MITLDRHEKVLLTARKHWFVFIGEMLAILLFAVAPFVLLILLVQFRIDPTEQINGNAPLLIGALLAGWLTISWVMLFVSWTHYYLDMLMLTDKKIVEVEQRSLFSREVSSFELDRIQDITIDTHGVIATLLDFGDLHIQTAGESREFILRSAARPSEIKKHILDAQEKQLDLQINI